MKAVQNCYVDMDWFSVKVGVRQGCVMSQWLFRLCMNELVREEYLEDGNSLWEMLR